MEIPVIARMSDFDASIATLANPSLVSRLLSVFELGTQRFWQWGVLLLALFYAVSSVAPRIKILFLQCHRRSTFKLSSTSEPLSVDDDADLVFSESEEEDDGACSSCSSEDERDRRDDLASSSCENMGGFYEDFRVAGSVNLGERQLQKRKFSIHRRRSLTGENSFSLADLVSGKCVVKLWDGPGLEVDLGDSPSIASGNSISILDLNKNVTIASIVGRPPALSLSPSSPKVVFKARAGCDGRVGVNSWDMRLRQRKPGVEAEWRLDRRTGPVLVEAGGVDKVFLRDAVSWDSTIGDSRKAKFPLENVTEYDGERWFDPDAVSETEGE